MITAIFIVLGCLVLSYFLFRKRIAIKLTVAETKVENTIHTKITEAKAEIKAVENEALGYVKDGINTVKEKI